MVVTATFLVRSSPRVARVNSLIESYSGSSSGVGFAIPVNYAKNIADQIIDGKTPVHPYMGATLSSVNALNARTNKLSTDSGAYVASVVEDGPAAKAGIQEGDVITKLGDDEITSADGLIIALRSHEVGEKVEITLMRGKEEKKVTVELGSDEELQNQQQNDSATDTGNGGITDEQLARLTEATEQGALLATHDNAELMWLRRHVGTDDIAEPEPYLFCFQHDWDALTPAERSRRCPHVGDR